MNVEAIDRAIFDMQLDRARNYLCGRIRAALDHCFDPVMEMLTIDGQRVQSRRFRSAWPYVDPSGWRVVCDPAADESILHFTWRGGFVRASKRAKKRAVDADVNVVQPVIHERVRAATSKNLELLIGHRWVCDPSSGVLLRPLSAGDVMVLGRMPAIGEVIEPFDDPLLVVDGFEYGSHSFSLQGAAP